MTLQQPTYVNGIYYKIIGEGPILLLLRGWGRSTRYWLGFDEELARHYRVVVLDNRGVGQTQRPLRWTDSIYDMADDIVEVLDHLQIPACHIFSLSLGGMIAMALAERHPERIRRMIIVNSSIAYPGCHRISAKALVALAFSCCHGDDFVRKQAEILLSQQIDDSTRAQVVADWKAIGASEPLRIRTHVIQLLAAARFRPARTLANFQDRIVVMYGGNDRLVPCSNSKRIATHLGDVPLVVIPAGGHELPIDSRERVIQVIRTELSK